MTDTVNVDTLVETVDNARRSIAASLIAVKGHLDKPYPDNPRWTPWTRFVERELRRLDEIKEVVSDLAARAREKVPAETLRRIQELEAINAQMTRHRDRLARRVAELESGLRDTAENLVTTAERVAELEAAENDRDRLREGLSEVRLRHMYSEPKAGEALAVWVLNGWAVADFAPKDEPYASSEARYQERIRIRDIARAALAGDGGGAAADNLHETPCARRGAGERHGDAGSTPAPAPQLARVAELEAALTAVRREASRASDVRSSITGIIGNIDLIAARALAGDGGGA